MPLHAGTGPTGRFTPLDVCVIGTFVSVGRTLATSNDALTAFPGDWALAVPGIAPGINAIETASNRAPNVVSAADFL